MAPRDGKAAILTFEPVTRFISISFSARHIDPADEVKNLKNKSSRILGRYCLVTYSRKVTPELGSIYTFIIIKTQKL
ncbi:hypothetical protein [Flavitalea antarctica]